MTIYAQFYTRDFMTRKPIEVSGVILLDCKDITGMQIRQSRKHMEDNSFIGFQICEATGTNKPEIIKYSEGETL